MCLFVFQVVLCKFHSVFLSQTGKVFTCGHGQGGRLGHGDEQTYLVSGFLWAFVCVCVCVCVCVLTYVALERISYN